MPFDIKMYVWTTLAVVRKNLFVCSAVISEKKRNTPETRKRNYRIDYSAYDRVLSAEQPGNQVKLENTDETPVERAKYGKDQTDFIKHFINSF